MTNENLLVVCRYTFNVESSGSAVSEAEIVYLLTYDRDGTPLAEEDVTQFAAANGVYHSWPFLRQLLYDLTSKMGFPPLTLPVFLVSPKATQQNKDVEESKEDNVPKTRLPAKRAKRKRS
jgi:hypothetical protein